MSNGWIFTTITLIIMLATLNAIFIIPKIANIPKDKKIKYKSSIYRTSTYLMLLNIIYYGHNINNLWIIYISGLTIIIWMLFKLSKIFIEKLGNIKFSLIVDFLVVIFITVYLIYKIPNEKIYDIILSIVGPLFGGVVTLIGVILTIRYNSLKDIERHKKTILPLLAPLERNGDEIISFKQTTNIKEVQTITLGNLEVLGNNIGKIKKLTINNEKYVPFGNRVINPGTKYRLRATLNNDLKEPFDINLFIDDVENNTRVFKIEIISFGLFKDVIYKGETHE